jgi:superfamily II DNA or RNA helicase
MTIPNLELDNILEKYQYYLTETVAVGRLYTRSPSSKNNTKHAILIDSNLYNLSAQTFHYVDYTSYQNKIMHQYSGMYRFLATDKAVLQAELALFLSVTTEDIELKIFGTNREEKHIDPTPPEYNFSLSFENVFGGKHNHALQAEAPYVDRQGHKRYVDFILHRKTQPIAIELNGEQYHHPLSKIVSKKKYRSQLFKQNSLVLDGYMVYRWSNRGMLDNFKFDDQLKDYFGDSQNFISAPLYRAQRHVDFTLYQHQNDAVASLQKKRTTGENTFLVVLPTGTGKTEIFIEDFRLEFSKGELKQTLAIVPSRELKTQLLKRIASQLPQIKTGEDLNDNTLDIIVQTSAYILRHYLKYPVDAFDYILIDEAHRAAAHGLRKVLEHFTPKNLLGLTATDQRLDQQQLEDIFGSYHIDLTLEQAIKKKLLPQIRAFRLQSNIDLSNVRFNGKEFVKSDLQKTIQVPSRDQLIVDLLLKYFSPKSVNAINNNQGVIFCVDIKHAKRMAKRLVEQGVKAAAVHGTDRAALASYHQGDIQFLCACDLLNEGWDAPQTSIIVMARPTMSKVLYTQQLGRGTRIHPDKEALYVIDVVDSYSAALQPWCVHNLFNFGMYQPFGNLVNGVEGTPSNNLIVLDSLWETERRLEPINIFNFEQEFGDLLNEEQLARELFVSTSTVKAWLKKGDINAHKTLPFGNKTLHYFSDQQLAQIKKDKNIKERTENTRKSDFFEFIDKRDYAFSYKISFLLIMISYANKQGELNLDILTEKYFNFYQHLTAKYGQAEKDNNPLNSQEKLTNNSYLKKSIRENPFEKFERKRFLYQCKDLNIISFDSVLWEKLTKADLNKIAKKMIEDGKHYFSKIGIALIDEDFIPLLKNTKPLTAIKVSNALLNQPASNADSNSIGTNIPYYADLKIACGHFKTSRHDEIESYIVPDGYGHLAPEKHFIANASGNSMNGGKNPIKDGDLLLLEWITPSSAGSISNQTVAIEIIDETGDSQYLLRVVKKQINGMYLLQANNPEYADKAATDQMHTFARLKAVISPEN